MSQFYLWFLRKPCYNVHLQRSAQTLCTHFEGQKTPQ